MPNETILTDGVTDTAPELTINGARDVTAVVPELEDFLLVIIEQRATPVGSPVSVSVMDVSLCQHRVARMFFSLVHHLLTEHQIRLLPNADIISALHHPFVERHPRRPMLVILTSGVGFQVLKRVPIRHNYSAHTRVTKATTLRMPIEFAQHTGHRKEQGSPLVSTCNDEKDNKSTFEIRGQTPRSDFGHAYPPIQVFKE